MPTPAPAMPPLPQDVEQFLTWMTDQKGFSPATISAYRTDLLQFEEWLHREQHSLARPGELEKYHFQDYSAHLFHEGQARSSIGRKLSALRSLFRYLMKMKKIDKNPAKLVRNPKRELRHPTALNVDQMFTLLDEASGSYNESCVERFFPQGGVRLVECVGRTQGLMLAPGNPLGLGGFADIARPGLRYVNRQKGSGTRILADYLCRKCGVDASKVYGYGREELTHTSVAAQIAAGSADAGMGIWSAARLYGLDFLPVCTEQYDLLIADSAWDSPAVRRLLEVLASPEFKSRLTTLGGYILDKPGKLRRRF